MASLQIKVASLVVAASLTSLALLAYLQLDAAVTKVQVRGLLDEAERGQVQTAVTRAIDGGLLSADLERVQESVLALGWPRSVMVRRSWPGTLEIEVEKPTVVARWQDAYLASDGKVVRLPGNRVDLPVFDCGLSEPKAAMELYHSLSEAGRAHDLSIARLAESRLGHWTVTFRNGLALTLGAEHLAERLDRFLIVYREHLAGRVLDRFLIVYREHLAGRVAEIAHVDARYGNGVAVSWVPVLPTEQLVAAAVGSSTGSEEL